jgi:hypothetical protein
MLDIHRFSRFKSPQLERKLDSLISKVGQSDFKPQASIVKEKLDMQGFGFDAIREDDLIEPGNLKNVGRPQENLY